MSPLHYLMIAMINVSSTALQEMEDFSKELAQAKQSIGQAQGRSRPHMMAGFFLVIPDFLCLSRSEHDHYNAGPADRCNGSLHETPQ